MQHVAHFEDRGAIVAVHIIPGSIFRHLDAFP
jgi:hypothetical protein